MKTRQSVTLDVTCVNVNLCDGCTVLDLVHSLRSHFSSLRRSCGGTLPRRLRRTIAMSGRKEDLVELRPAITVSHHSKKENDCMSSL